MEPDDKRVPLTKRIRDLNWALFWSSGAWGFAAYGVFSTGFSFSCLGDSSRFEDGSGTAIAGSIFMLTAVFALSKMMDTMRIASAKVEKPGAKATPAAAVPDEQPTSPSDVK